MPLVIEIEREADGRWLAEIPSLPGVSARARTRDEAVDRVRVLALRLMSDRLDQGEPSPALDALFAAES